MFWATFRVLYAAALLGGLALMPYTLRLLQASSRPLGQPVGRILLLGFVQTAVLFAVVVAIGLLASRAVGLGAPYVARALGGPSPVRPVGTMLRHSLLLGGSIGAAMLVVDLFLLPRFPGLLALARATTVWDNFTASFYGGLNEEFLTRLLGLSAIAWALSRFWHLEAGRPTAAVFWSANAIMAVLFALGHLPAGKAVVGTISPLFVGRTLVLNVPLAIGCGWLFWQYGIEAAVLAHFAADILYHVGGTLVLLANDHVGWLPWISR